MDNASLLKSKTSVKGLSLPASRPWRANTPGYCCGDAIPHYNRYRVPDQCPRARHLRQDTGCQGNANALGSWYPGKERLLGFGPPWEQLGWNLQETGAYTRSEDNCLPSNSAGELLLSYFSSVIFSLLLSILRGSQRSDVTSGMLMLLYGILDPRSTG